MKRNQTVQVFTGIDTKKDETLIGMDKLRLISNFDTDKTSGSLSIINGSEIKNIIFDAYIIKGAYYFKCIAHPDDVSAIGGIRKFLIICYADPYTENAQDAVRVFDVTESDESEIYLSNAYQTNYIDFITNQMGCLTVSERYDFISTNNECIINNRNNVPFKFSLDSDDEEHTNYKFSFVTLPNMFQISSDKNLNYEIITPPTQAGELEAGEYWYKYSYLNSTDNLESMLSAVNKINTLGTSSKILENSNGYDLYVCNSLEINDFLFLKFGYRAVSQMSLEIALIQIHQIKLKTIIYYKTEDWQTICSQIQKSYESGDIGILLQISIYSSIDYGQYGHEEGWSAFINSGYIPIKNNEIDLSWKKVICYLNTVIEIPISINGLIKYPINTSNIFSDIEYFILSYQLGHASVSNEIILSKINDESTTQNLRAVLKGKNVTKETYFKTYTHNGIIYNIKNTYIGKDFLADTDEFKNYSVKWRGLQSEDTLNNDNLYITENTFYNFELNNILSRLPESETDFDILLNELKITIPFNKTIKEIYKIDKVRIYRVNLSGGEPTVNYFLDNELDITFNIVTKEWDTDLDYSSNKNDLSNMYNSTPFNEEYIVIPVLNQMLFHNNKLFVVDKAEGLVRFSELITTGMQYFKETSYIFFSQNDGGRITGLSAHQDNLIIFLQNKIFTVFGVSYEDNQWVIQSRSIGEDINGCIAEYSICQTPKGIIYLSNDGFKITDSFNIVTLDGFEKKYDSYFKRINKNALNKINSWFNDGKYYCSLALDSDTEANHIFVYNIYTNQFVFYSDFDIDYVIRRQAEDTNIYFISNRCKFNKPYGMARPVSFIKKISVSRKSYEYDRHIFISAASNSGTVNPAFRNYSEDLTGYYVEIERLSHEIGLYEFYSIHRISHNTSEILTIEGEWPGYIIDPVNYTKPILGSTQGIFRYRIIKPITAHIETGAYMFGAPECAKSMNSIEIFYKNSGAFGKLKIEYSLDGSEYQILCSTGLGAAGTYGTGMSDSGNQGAYFDSGNNIADYYNRIGKIPFRKIQRFDSIRFKIEYTGIDAFDLRKLLYTFNIHKQRMNRFRFLGE